MTPELPEALQVALRVIEVLDELGIHYHLGGSYASSLHGFPRQTQDIDMVIDLDRGVVGALSSQLASEFYLDEIPMLRAVENQSSFNLIHLDSGIKIDMFILGTDDFDRVEFGRHRPEVVQEEPERRVFVKTPEDIVLRKLQWYRLGGEVSDRQWTDVLNVIHTQGDRLDRDYLEQWASRLGITDLLDRVIRGGR